MSLESAPPRDEATVDAVAGEFIRRTNRFARNLALIFYVVAGSICAIFAIAMSTADVEPKVVITGLVCVLLFIGVLPAELLRSTINGDARFARRLVREGELYPASITRGIASPAQTVLTVSWTEGEREVMAKVTAPASVRDITGDVRVLSASSLFVVGVLLGEHGMYIGRRS